MFSEENWLLHNNHMRMLLEADQKHRREHNGEPIYNTELKAQALLKMLYLDLDPVMGIIGDLYSPSEGAPSKQVDKVFRSDYLRIAVNGLRVSSMGKKKWAKEVDQDPFWHLLIGCKEGEKTPRIASHYDLANKLWAGDLERYSSNSSYSARKNAHDGKLEIGPDNKIVDKAFKISTMHDEFMQEHRLSGNQERYLQQLVTLLAVFPSMENGVIPRVHCCGLDSTAWAEKACVFGKAQCDKRMNCPYRANCGLSGRYSCPDGHIGYDSGRRAPFFGEHLNIVTCYNRDCGLDLPIFFMLADAERHDSITFFPLMQEFFRNVPGFFADYFLLDGAFDYLEIYDLLLQNGIIPNISLCSNHCGLEGLPKGFTISKNGMPCCHDGHPLTLVRNNSETKCWEFQCPLKTGHRKGCCPNEATCKLYKCSMALVINPLSSDRLFCCIPRDSEEFRGLYKGRSSSERMNNRVLNDYKLDLYKERNANHRSLLTAHAIINLHTDGWIRMGIKPKNPLAQELYDRLFADNEKYSLGLEKLLKASATPPHTGEKVDWEGTISMFRKRNRQERYEDRVWAEKVEEAREARRAEKEGFTWQCPRKVAEEKKAKGEGAFDNLPEADSVKTKIPVLPGEKYYVKSWEKTYYDYEPDSVVIDLAEPEDKPWKGLILEEVLITEGRYKGWKLIRWVKAKDFRLPREIREGFIHVKAKVWVRPAAEAVEETFPMVKTSTVSKAEIMGAKEVDFTKEIYQDPDFRPPCYGLIDWNNIQWEGTNCNSEELVKLYSDPETAKSQTEPFPQLVPNYTWCRQPAPREFVRMEHARLYGAG